MKAAGIRQIRVELQHKSKDELISYCEQLAKYKVDNKLYLSFLLFDKDREEDYVEEIKEEMKEALSDISSSQFYLVKKSVRKVQKQLRSTLRFVQKKESGLALQLSFCEYLLNMKIGIENNKVLSNMFLNHLKSARKIMKGLHEDLQYDYTDYFDEIEKKAQDRIIL